MTLGARRVDGVCIVVWGDKREGVLIFSGWEKGEEEGGRRASWRDVDNRREGVSTRRRRGAGGVDRVLDGEFGS